MNIPKQSVKLQQSYGMDVPAIIGIRNRIVLLPVADYTVPEYTVIFTHELQHHRQQDLILKAVAILIIILHWYNPAAWLLGQSIMRWSEYACDYECSRVLPDVKEYFRIIERMIPTQKNKVTILSSTLFEGKTELERRVERMRRYLTIKRKRNILAITICICMLLISSLSVSAASVSIVDRYSQIFKSTIIEVKEDLVEDLYVEKTEYLLKDENAITVGELDYELSSQTNSFEWEISPGTVTRTGFMYMEAGCSIPMTVVATPNNQSYKCGLYRPGGMTIHVDGTGIIMHTFNISSSGFYAIYVENCGSTTFTANGYYIKVNPNE